jgi:hypothetical protein
MFTIQSSTIYHRTEKRMLKTHISITNNTDTKLRPSNPKHTNQDQWIYKISSKLNFS